MDALTTCCIIDFPCARAELSSRPSTRCRYFQLIGSDFESGRGAVVLRGVTCHIAVHILNDARDGFDLTVRCCCGL